MKDVNEKSTLLELKSDIISSTQRGYPILMSGALYFLLLTGAPFLFSMETVHLIWVVGLGVIFPFGILLGRILGINILVTGNPLGNLGGMVAGTQGFFIPIFVLVYLQSPEYLPLTIGLLGGAHFFAIYVDI